MPTKSVKILLVEDDPQIRQVIRELLRGDQRQITVTEDGSTAFLKLQNEVFDLLVTDLGLPGPSGWDLIEEGLKLSPDMRVIVITSWTDSHSEESAQKLRVDYIIQKPFRISQVKEAVEDILSDEVFVGQK